MFYNFGTPYSIISKTLTNSYWITIFILKK